MINNYHKLSYRPFFDEWSNSFLQTRNIIPETKDFWNIYWFSFLFSQILIHGNPAGTYRTILRISQARFVFGNNTVYRCRQDATLWVVMGLVYVRALVEPKQAGMKGNFFNNFRKIEFVGMFWSIFSCKIGTC